MEHESFYRVYYQYVVDGISYENVKREVFRRYEDAEIAYEQDQEGNGKWQIEIWYDAENPSKSTADYVDTKWYIPLSLLILTILYVAWIWRKYIAFYREVITSE